MHVEKPNPDEWWWGTSSEFRTFCRDVVRLVQDVLDGEVLELRFNGGNFSPVLRSKRDVATQPGRTGELMKPCEQSPEQWWAGLAPNQREFIQELGKLVGFMQRDRDKVLEIRNTGGTFNVKMVLKLKRPTGGKAATN